MPAASEKILVIKTGALGDFIQALGPMAAIRRHHPQAHITLLTGKPYAGFGRDCGYFDDVWIDPRPRGVKAWIDWRRALRGGHFTRVYDLQNSERTEFYSWLLWPRRPEWVGAARFASHRNASPARTAGHAFDGHVQTLAGAGVTGIAADDLSWIKGDAAVFELPTPYALLIPGCSPGHPEKRWPAERYGDLAAWLAARGITPVIVGTQDEAAAADIIVRRCPAARNLLGQTNLADVAVLARNAALAVGNDTGPIHIIAATGCKTLVLYSQYSDPARVKPQGGNVALLRRDTLDNLTLEDVEASIRQMS